MKVSITRPPLIGTSFLAFLFLTAVSVVLSAPQSEPHQDLCVIKGRVIDAVTREGLRKAFVRLIGKGGAYPTVTNEMGEFALESISPGTPGTYTLQAERQGFIETHFGDVRGVPIEIRLTSGQTLTDISIKLIPQAIISGRVVDEDGDVWTHSQVSLFRSGFEHGRRKLKGFGGGEVNDQGEFRIGQIPPGNYYVSAEPDTGWELRNRPRGIEAAPPRQVTWYPSSVDPGGATAISLGPGDQLSGLEIRLRRGAIHRIQGKLVGGENIVEDSGRFGKRNISANPTSDAGVNRRPGVIHSDGSFEIPNVPSGTYEIQVRQGFPPINLGTLKVEVDDGDLEDVSLPLTPPRPLNGMIQIEAQGSITSSEFTVQLDSFVPSMSPSAVSRADGSFYFPMVGSERYRVTVWTGPGFYLKEIIYGDAVSNDGTISLTGPEAKLVLILSERGARLSGKVNRTNDQKSTADQTRGMVSTFQVVLVPNGAPGKARLAIFDQNGEFSLRDLAPGAYKLYAFEGVPDGAWEDPDLMKELSGAGMEIPLTEGEVKSVEVPLLLKATLAATLKKLGLE